MRLKRIAVAAALAIVVLFMLFCIYLLTIAGISTASAQKVAQTSGPPEVDRSVEIYSSPDATPVPTVTTVIYININGTRTACESNDSIVCGQILADENNQKTTQETVTGGYINAGIGFFALLVVAVLGYFATINAAKFSTGRNDATLKEDIKVIINGIEVKMNNLLATPLRILSSFEEQVLIPQAREAVRKYEDQLEQQLIAWLTERRVIYKVHEDSQEFRVKALVPYRLQFPPERIGHIDGVELSPLLMIEQDVRHLDKSFSNSKMIELSINNLSEWINNIAEPLASQGVKSNLNLVLGDAGAGKTTLLKCIALETIRESQPHSNDKDIPYFPIPIYIDLWEFFKSQSEISMDNLLKFAANQIASQAIEPGKSKPDSGSIHSYLDKEQKANQVRFFLDGIDEYERVTSVEDAPSLYNKICKSIEDLAKNCRVVVSQSRMQFRLGLGRGVSNVGRREIVNLHPEEIRLFIDRWIGTRTGLNSSNTSSEALALKSVMDRDPRLQSLAANPLMLCHIVERYTGDGEGNILSPGRRREFYQECIDFLLDRLNEENANPDQEQKKRQDRKHLLRAIAWYLHRKGKYVFEYNRLAQKLPVEIITLLNMPDRSQEEWTRYVDELIKSSGLFTLAYLEDAGPGFKFSSIVLQEYLAAEYISNADQWETLIPEISQAWITPWWEEVFALVCSMKAADSASTDALQKIIESASAGRLTQKLEIELPDQSLSESEDERNKKIELINNWNLVCRNVRNIQEIKFKSRVFALYPQHLLRSDSNKMNLWIKTREQLRILLQTETCYFAYELLVDACHAMSMMSIDEVDRNRVKPDRGGSDSSRFAQTLVGLNGGSIFYALLPMLADPATENTIIQKLSSIDYSDPCPSFTTLWDARTDFNDRDRIRLAHAVGLIDQTVMNHQAMVGCLLEKLEQDPQVLVGWMLAYSIKLLYGYADSVIEGLLGLFKRRANGTQSQYISWSILNTLYEFAVLGNRSITGKLQDVFRDQYKSLQSDELQESEEFSAWHLAYILNLLDGKIGDMLDGSRLATPGISDPLASIIKMWFNKPHREDAIKQLLAFLKRNDLSVEERVCAYYLLSQIGSDDKLFDDRDELFDVLCPTQLPDILLDEMSRSMFFRVVYVNDRRMWSKEAARMVTI